MFGGVYNCWDWFVDMTRDVLLVAVVDELSVVAIMTKIIITRPTNASVIDKFKIRMVEPMADR